MATYAATMLPSCGLSLLLLIAGMFGERAAAAPKEAAVTTEGDVFVSPTAGDDGNDGSRSAPFKTLTRAQVAVRGGARTVHLLPGVYQEARAMELTDADSGSTWVADAAAGTAIVSGGLSITPAQLSPVTDAGALAQLPAAARSHVKQVNLTALGLTAGDLGDFSVTGSLNGNACLVVDRLKPHGLEVFFGKTAGVFAR